MFAINLENFIMPLSKNFTFNGGAGSYFGTSILAMILTSVTLGFGYPWALCMMQKWRCEHTFIQGRQLSFVGTGGEFLGQWIKWFLLTIITLGIYSFWLVPALNKWIAEHTDFADAR